MQIENGKIDGDFLVNQDLTLNGMVTGTVTVAPGVSLHVHGMCCGDLVVSSGATAIVLGTVVGNLRNQGVVELRGVVNGDVLSRGAQFRQSPSARIDGRIET